MHCVVKNFQHFKEPIQVPGVITKQFQINLCYLSQTSHQNQLTRWAIPCKYNSFLVHSPIWFTHLMYVEPPESWPKKCERPCYCRLRAYLNIHRLQSLEHYLEDKLRGPQRKQSVFSSFQSFCWKMLTLRGILLLYLGLWLSHWDLIVLCGRSSERITVPFQCIVKVYTDSPWLCEQENF